VSEITQDMTHLAYRQEILAEDVEDVLGALWKHSTIDAGRVRDYPDLSRVVVGVDPPGGVTECGIVVAGTALCPCGGKAELHAFVIEDASIKAPPDVWAASVVSAYRRHEADRVLGETNFGGDMVESTLRTADRTIRYTKVSASRGKAVRAEPISALYEQGKVHHVGYLRAVHDKSPVKNISKNEVALDLESVTVNGQRYGIQTQDSVVSPQQADGLGANKRTGKFVGGGAVIGAIIGAIAGGGKGAAIGGGIGAAAGAGTQVLTRGKTVNVPAESLVTFRLQQPLRTGGADSGFNRDGQHYHPGYGTNSGKSAAYQDGLQAGRSDSDRNLNRNARSNRWTSGQQLRDYQAGYSSGYDEASRSVQQGNGSVRIGSDHNIRWQGPANAQVYVQVDNKPRQLFAAGASGTQLAPWMTSGHLYVFVLQDPSGHEIARDQSDLRQKRRLR
jgi:Terminase RNaseH-like domain